MEENMNTPHQSYMLSLYLFAIPHNLQDLTGTYMIMFKIL